MLAIDQLMAFYVAIVNDKGITTSHISLYMALFKCWNLNNNQNPVSINRQEVMQIAKINGQATYHKCMRELQDLGYIEYRPSYHPILGSQVYLNILKKDWIIFFPIHSFRKIHFLTIDKIFNAENTNN